ncbi:prominin-like protein isoform X2 [Eupeodes corollae]|uniref:prominin-like protein isoform X2 n=1 Tax=Eupeodes corollae TaxID=290404 RepID=UPI0024911AD2|nr:prominin-like protein isoform X2 [Eupeodes corollae]
MGVPINTTTKKSTTATMTDAAFLTRTTNAARLQQNPMLPTRQQQQINNNTTRSTPPTNNETSTTHQHHQSTSSSSRFSSLSSHSNEPLNVATAEDVKSHRRWRRSTSPTSSSSSLSAAAASHFMTTLMTMCVLLAVMCSLPGLTTATDDIEMKLDLTKTEYSVWNKNTTYLSSTKFNARGMSPFYNITHEVMKLFIGQDAIPNGYIVVTEKGVRFGPKVEHNEWGDLIKHYWPILLVVILTALLVILMPIIGLCFCCCRCAGACGGRSQPFDKKHDTCRRVFLGFLLICAATGILFGVIIAFTTNAYMQEGVDDATTAVRHGSKDTGAFLKATSQQMNHLLVENYHELSQQLEYILKNTSSSLIRKLEETSKAVSLNHLVNFLADLPKINVKLHRMKNITNELRVYASQLSDGLRGVKRDLLVMLTKCQTQECKNVLENYEIGKLDTNGFDYNQLPDVTSIIESVDTLIKNGDASAGKDGRQAWQNLQNDINRTITEHIPKIIDSMEKVGQALKKTSEDISGRFTQISKEIDEKTNSATTTADKYIHEYSIYRFYAGIAISSVLLVILTALTCALFCGICGKRPDGYGDDCCNKGSGSRFLMLAVAVIFLTISILAVAALVHFLVGLVLQRGVCTPLRNPKTDDVFQYIDNFVDLNNVFYNNNNPKQKIGSLSTGNLPPFRISHVIAACQANETIYEVLHLYNHFDIESIKEYPAQLNVTKTLREFVDGINFESKIVILSEENEQRIRAIATSGLNNFDRDKFTDNLNENITIYSLKALASQLRKTADKIKGTSMNDVQVGLRNQALHLETYEDNLVLPMREQTRELIALAEELQSKLSYNHKSFERSIESLVEEIKQAQNFINEDGRTFIKKTAETLTTFFTEEIQRYLDLVIKSIQTIVGKCAPLAHVYDSAIVATCNKFVDPLNGFWAGVAWCVILFLPTLVISVKLSSLYQKSDPYPGPLVESEYLYDAYSERDHIPLANGPKNKRRKSKERRRTSRDRRADYFEDSGSSHGPGPAGGRDTRYNDMAPKHWDGGPPRYQNPPMAPPASEYERPPPYYYPGASDQD